MGGLITRAYIHQYQLLNVGKCVFIATPHKGSSLANILVHAPHLSKLIKPITTLLTENNHQLCRMDKKIKIGAIAGNRNNLLVGKLFLSNESDGRVEVLSVKTDDLSDFVLLPLNHHKIHHSPETLSLVQSFLQYGSFKK
jgi:hypothetical protein